MSSHVEYTDPSAQVIWFSFEGRCDELEVNLRAYGVDYVPALRPRSSSRVCRVGIRYRRNLDTIDKHALMDAAVALLDLLTAQKGITEKDQERFIAELQVVQSFQPEGEEVYS